MPRENQSFQIIQNLGLPALFRVDKRKNIVYEIKFEFVSAFLRCFKPRDSRPYERFVPRDVSLIYSRRNFTNASSRVRQSPRVNPNPFHTHLSYRTSSNNRRVSNNRRGRLFETQGAVLCNRRGHKSTCNNFSWSKSEIIKTILLGQLPMLEEIDKT